MESTQKAAKNHAALKAKLIEEFKELGGKLEDDEDGDETDEKQAAEKD